MTDICGQKWLRTDETALTAIRATAERIRPYTRETPLVAMWKTGLQLKAESLQPTGAFKLRGAFNAILSLDPEQRERGIVAHSSGNHALAVAYAGKILEVRTTIVMPCDAPITKRRGVEYLGAEIVTVGPTSDERSQRAFAIARERSLSLIEPYDGKEIILGAATIALEVLGDRPDLANIFVPVSGGGLLAGIALGVKLLKPSVTVIGVEPSLSPHAHNSLKSGILSSVSAADAGRTCADGLRVQRLGELNWEIIRNYVDDILLISEEEIHRAIISVAAEARLVAEPSGAVAIAGALASKSVRYNYDVAVLSGGNVDLNYFSSVVQTNAGSAG